MGSNPKIVHDLTCNEDFETAFENPFTTSHRGDDYSLSNVLSKGSARIYNAKPSFPEKIERKCRIFSVKSESSYPRTYPALASRKTSTIMENSDAHSHIISPTSIRGNPNPIPEKSGTYFPVTSPSFANPNIVLGNSNVSFPKISSTFVGGNPSTIPEQSNSHFSITSPAYARGNPNFDSSFPILETSDVSFPLTSPAFARANPTSIPEKSRSYFPTTPRAYARENPNFNASFPIIAPPSGKGNQNTEFRCLDASFPVTSRVFGRRNPNSVLQNSRSSFPKISPSFVRGNPISIPEKSNSYFPLNTPSFASGHLNSMPVKSHAINPTSGINIGGTRDGYQQLEDQIRLRFCAQKKCNDSLPSSGQHGVGTTQKNHLEGVTRSTFQQNRSFTSCGSSSLTGKDWYAERAAAYFQDTPPIQKRKRDNDDENSVNKKLFMSSSQILFDFQAGYDDRLNKKPFLPSLQPAMYETAWDLFKDEKVSALQISSNFKTNARMLKLETLIDTVTPRAQTGECTRKDKGKSVPQNGESCKVNTYDKGKNIQMAVSTRFSIEEMERFLEIDGNTSENYTSGVLACDNIIETSRKLPEKEEEFLPWMLDDCTGHSYVPISEPQNLVHVAMDTSKNPNVSIFNDEKFGLLPEEENPSNFHFHQHFNSGRKDCVNRNPFDNMTETGCEQKEGEPPISGCGEVVYTENLGDIGFASECMKIDQ